MKKTSVRYTCALCGGATVRTTVNVSGIWVCEPCQPVITEKEGLYNRLHTIFLNPKTRWYTQDNPTHHQINMMATCVLKRTTRTIREKKIIDLISTLEPPTAPMKEMIK